MVQQGMIRDVIYSVDYHIIGGVKPGFQSLALYQGGYEGGVSMTSFS